MTATSIEARLCAAMASAGLTPPPSIIGDGQLHRFSTNGRPDDDAGWYTLFTDGVPAGAFGDFRSGLKGAWSAKGVGSMTREEREAHRQRVERMQRERDAAELQRHEQAAATAQHIWSTAQPAPAEHPYFMRKKVTAHDLRIYSGDLAIAGHPMNGALIIPVHDETGQLWSLEFITPDGGKFFLPGGRKRGCFFSIGDPGETVCLAEGYATASSIFEATGLPVIVAFDAGNLTPVAEAIRAGEPDSTIVLCGDHDASGTGQKAAREAAARVAGVVAIPDEVGHDWNDVFLAHGPEVVRSRILGAISAPEAPAPTEAPRASDEVGLTKWLADSILATHHFARDAGGLLYAFLDGVYQPHGEEVVSQSVKRILEQADAAKRWSSHRAREVVGYINVDAPRLWNEPPANILNVKNGLLNLATRELSPHDPKHLSSVQIPVTYDPDAACPNWERFVTQVLAEDCYPLVWEIIALSMCPNRSIQQAIILVGEGGNGKSLLLWAVMAFLGPGNVSGLSLQRLEHDKFAVVRLLGKLANICPDLPSDRLTSSSTFKTVTGGDTLVGERKFQGSFEFSPFARLIFSANHYPQSADSSSAFFRRWAVLPFERTFTPDKQIPRHILEAQLADPTELSGVLNHALDALAGLVTRGRLTETETTRAALAEFRELTDPLAVWLDQHTEVQGETFTSRKDLLIAYNAACDDCGRPPMTAKAFCRAIRRLRPTTKDGQRNVCGQTQWVFLGLALKNRDSRDSRDSQHFSSPVELDGGDVTGEPDHTITAFTRCSEISLEVSEIGVRGREEEKTIKLGDRVNAVNAVCGACGASKWWQSIHGATVCGTCHPPATERLVAEWL